jgi:glycosyltransferase involved in cell wall biosynthesis
MAGIEALRHGLAIVGSRIGGLSDVIDDGVNGFFCDLTPQAFAENLRSLLGKSDALVRMRQASLAKARDFNLPDRVRDYEALLGDVAAKRG